MNFSKQYYEKAKKFYNVNTWKVGDKVRSRIWNNSEPMISRDYGYVKEISDRDSVWVYWPLKEKMTEHDIDLIPA